MSDNLNQEAIEALMDVCNQLDEVQIQFHSVRFTIVLVKEKLKSSIEVNRKKRKQENAKEIENKIEDPDSVIKISDDEDEDPATTALILESLNKSKFQVVQLQKDLFQVKELIYTLISNFKERAKWNVKGHSEHSAVASGNIAIPSTSKMDEEIQPDTEPKIKVSPMRDILNEKKPDN